MDTISNFREVDTVQLIISEVEKLLETQTYFPALYLALTLPDLLGKLAYPEEEKNKYIKWFDENVWNTAFYHKYSSNPLHLGEDFPKMNGEVCYSLRCKLFHEGRDSISTSQMSIDEFVLSFTDEDFVRGNNAGYDADGVKYLYISCRGLCIDILSAAKKFRNDNPDLNYPKTKVNEGHGRINKSLFGYR